MSVMEIDTDADSPAVAWNRKLGWPACMLEHDPVPIWILERLALLVPVRVERLDRLVAQIL